MSSEVGSQAPWLSRGALWWHKHLGLPQSSYCWRLRYDSGHTAGFLGLSLRRTCHPLLCLQVSPLRRQGEKNTSSFRVTLVLPAAGQRARQAYSPHEKLWGKRSSNGHSIPTPLDSGAGLPSFPKCQNGKMDAQKKTLVALSGLTGPSVPCWVTT